MLATTVDFLKESGEVLLIMTGPPLRCHPCRLPANANIVFALPLRLNHFPRKSHSLRRIYAGGSSPFLLETFRLSVGTGDRSKLLGILLPLQRGYRRQEQASLYPSSAIVWAQETGASFSVLFILPQCGHRRQEQASLYPSFCHSVGTGDRSKLVCTLHSATVWAQEIGTS